MAHERDLLGGETEDLGYYFGGLGALDADQAAGVDKGEIDVEVLVVLDFEEVLDYFVFVGAVDDEVE